MTIPIDHVRQDEFEMVSCLSYGENEVDNGNEFESLHNYFKVYYARRGPNEQPKIPDEVAAVLRAEFNKGHEDGVTIQPGQVYKDLFETNGKHFWGSLIHGTCWYYKVILPPSRIKTEYSKFQKKLTKKNRAKGDEEVSSFEEVITKETQEAFFNSGEEEIEFHTLKDADEDLGLRNPEHCEPDSEPTS